MTSPPGRCSLAVILFAAVAVATWLCCDPAGADPKPKETKITVSATPKTKTYTFGGLDIDGRLKTPQLLYFLGRMQGEFDATATGRRSFLPEIVRSTNDL